MTAKKLKAMAPAFWQAVEDLVYCDCKNAMRVYSRRKTGILFVDAMNDDVCKRIAHNAAFIATDEFVSRGKRTTSGDRWQDKMHRKICL